MENVNGKSSRLKSNTKNVRLSVMRSINFVNFWIICEITIIFALGKTSVALTFDNIAKETGAHSVSLQNSTESERNEKSAISPEVAFEAYEKLYENEILISSDVAEFDNKIRKFVEFEFQNSSKNISERVLHIIKSNSEFLKSKNFKRPGNSSSEIRKLSIRAAQRPTRKLNTAKNVESRRSSIEIPSRIDYGNNLTNKSDINTLSKVSLLGLFELTTPTGGDRWEGKSELAAAKLAVKHVNERGLLPGYVLELITNDTQVRMFM